MSDKCPKTIEVNGTTYIRSDINQPAEELDGMPYVIVRTYSAGVFAGYLKEKDGQHAVVVNARRLWYWSGAASLSQLSQEGVKNPNECKFPMEVPSVELEQVIEVLPCSVKAQRSINDVEIWTA